MSRSEPVLGLRKPGARKQVSDEEARLLEERLSAAEAATPDAETAGTVVSLSPVDAASPSDGATPTRSRATSPKPPNHSVKETTGASRRETNTRSAASYPRGKGSKADPYRRAKDGKALRSTTVFIADDMHERLRMYCAQHERSQSEVIAEALELLLPGAR